MAKKSTLMTFNQALSECHDQDKSVLLGNGFSIAWEHKIFSYNSLKDQAKDLDKDVLAVFSALDTVDFEEVIDAFNHAGIVCTATGIKNNFPEQAEKIRDLLIETIAANHPDYPSKISQKQFDSCVGFLKNFNARIYTLNYDMLLYWVLMRDMFRDDGTESQIENCEDGFAYNDEEFLNWDGTNFNIHYLHGALHLFEQEATLKLNYQLTGESLKSQFIKLIKKQKKFPLFVAEGDSRKKLRRIHSSGYLTRCINSLQKIGSKKTLLRFSHLGCHFRIMTSTFFRLSPEIIVTTSM